MTLDLRLAPMAAVTNAPFRLVARECGAGPLTSEEIDARGLVEGSARTAELARSLPEERPIAMQLLGADGDVLAEAAPRLEAAGVDDARAMVAAPGCAAVMIGRGALGRPWIFRGEAVSRREQAEIIRRHAALIEAHCLPRTALIQLKKHLAWYAHGLPGAALMREALFRAPSPTEAYALFWRIWCAGVVAGT